MSEFFDPFFDPPDPECVGYGQTYPGLKQKPDLVGPICKVTKKGHVMLTELKNDPILKFGHTRGSK